MLSEEEARGFWGPGVFLTTTPGDHNYSITAWENSGENCLTGKPPAHTETATSAPSPTEEAETQQKTSYSRGGQ